MTGVAFATLQSVPWAYPVLEIVHLFGIALLLGNLVAFEWRLFGRSAGLPLRDFARVTLWLSVAGFALALLSGVLMFATQPEELLANRAFLAKMGLMLAAGLNAGWFHGRRGLARADRTARAQMLVSVLLWTAVLAAGRWVAY